LSLSGQRRKTTHICFTSYCRCSHILGLDPRTRDFLAFCTSRIEISNSQILQDLFVLWVLREKRGGYFVDFGATDGIELSNSYLLETKYGWNGIVAEPAKDWHASLRRNRQCSVEFDCVSDRSGSVVSFDETPGLGLSTMASFADDDRHAESRQDSVRYDVRTVSLNDLLQRHDAPGSIDYISIDTEGSELSILGAFDFQAYKPSIVTVEHNFVDAKRGAIFEVMTRNGYKRHFEALSMFDDWYVHQDIEF